MALIIHNQNFKTKSTAIFVEDIVDFVKNKSSFDNFHLIVPTGKLSKKIKKDFIKDYYHKTGRPISEIKIYTLSKFSEMIFKNIFEIDSYRKISDAFARVLFEEADEISDLKFFKKSGKKLNSIILNKLANIILGLKEDGISFNNMMNDISKFQDGDFGDVNDPKKYTDIYELFINYEKKLGNKLIDSATIINKLNNFLATHNSENTLNNIFKKDDICLVYGFSEFKNPEIQLLSFFNNVNFSFAINFDFSATNGPLFGNLKEIIDSFVQAGYDKTDLDELHNQTKPNANFDITDPNISPSKFFRRWLFNVEKEIRHSHFSNIIKILEAENIEDETESIIKLIKYLCTEQNITPSDICIVSRKPEIYSELFREKFKSETIPVNVTDRFELSKSPVIIAIFAVLDLINRGFNRDDLNRFVTNPFITIMNTTENREIDGVNLYNTAIKLKIFGGHSRGGSKSWVSRINNRIDFNLKRIKYIEDYSDSNELDIKILQNENDLLKLALSDFNSLLLGLESIKKDISLNDFTIIIKDSIIKKFQIKENIIRYYEKIHTFSDNLRGNEYSNLIEIVEKDSKSLWSFIQLFDEFISIYKERFNTNFPLLELTKRLKTSVEATKYQIKEKFNYGVTVTSIEQIRGIEFKVLILCGCLDGSFPVAYKPDIFLGKHLPDSENRHLKSEQMIFYQFLTNSSKLVDNSDLQIYITYPLFDEDRDLVRSPFIDSLLKITDLEQRNKIFNLKSLKKIDANNPKQIQQLEEIEWLTKICLNSEKQMHRANIQLSKYLDDGIIYNDKLTNDYLDYFCKSNFKNGILELNPDNETEMDSLTSYCKKTFSITEFERFQSCPFSHFAERILRLKSTETIDISLSPLEIGNFYHNVAYLFYSQLQKNAGDKDPTIDIMSSINGKFPDINCVRLDINDKPRYFELLIDIAKNEIERIRFDHPFFEFEESEIFGRNNKKGILENWLDLEIERFNDNWDTAPGLFEMEFGNYNEPIFLNEDIKIRGKIDRIEIENSESGYRIKIADYKTNLKNTKSNNDILNLTSFQMPIYIYVSQFILSRYYNIDTEVIGGIYYGWKGFTDKSYKYVLVNAETETSGVEKREKLKNVDQKQIIDNVINETQKIINLISDGKFELNVKENICRYCNFTSICRKNDKITKNV